MKNYFSQWIELGCEYNKSLLNDAVTALNKPANSYDSMIDGVVGLSNSLFEGCSSAPTELLQNQMQLMEKQLQLGESMIRRLSGEQADPVISAAKGDQRFSDDEWRENPLFDYIKQSYLLNSQALLSMSEHMELDDKKKATLDYYLRQFSSALAPTNFPLTNPEVLKKIKETKGENICRGMKFLLDDQLKSGSFLNIAMSNDEEFSIGGNLACTAGEVVYENDLMQLIQYHPATEKVHSRPLLLIPSWVNKFYILDLQQRNSFVRWVVDQGFSLYMISWVNPDTSHRDVGFEHLLGDGVLEAVKQIKSISGSAQVNAAGYCLGGILLASALAYNSKHGDESIACATYLATSLNYDDPGDISIFLDEATVSTLEKNIQQVGYLDGRQLALCFNLLRENDLYWNYYVQNYLKGERPRAFDILHWNSDSTNVSAKAHSFVLRDLHLNNGLVNNTVTLLGTPIELSAVNTPLYVLATDKDHIARWQSTYSAINMQGGERRFVLAGSGHIAGVVNHPDSNKYYHYTNTALADEPEQWLAQAEKVAGSWWVDWSAWLAEHSGERVAAQSIDSARVIEPAPGRYVLRRLDGAESVAAAA